MRFYIDISHYSTAEAMPTVRYVRGPCASSDPCFWIEADNLFITLDREAFQHLIKRYEELMQQGPEIETKSPTKEVQDA